MSSSLVHTTGQDAIVQHLSSQDASPLVLYLHTHKSSPETLRAYRSDLLQFFAFVAGTDKLELDEVSADDVRRINHLMINEFLHETIKYGLKDSTVARKRACITKFFNWCEALSVVGKSPAQKELLVRVSKGDSGRDVTYISEADARRLVQAARTDKETATRDYTLILVLIYCVLRRSEAANMDCGHIEKVDEYWKLTKPKTKSGEKWISIPAHIAEAIEDHKIEYGIVSGPLWRSHSNRNQGLRLTPHSISRIVYNCAMRAGIGEIYAHVLRHTGCTLALKYGANIEQVRELAGHAHVNTTAHYIHNMDKLRDTAANKIPFIR